jgi:hypothetical protein
MKDHFIHPSRRPSVQSWSVYSDRAEKTVEYKHGGCLHIINNFYLPHVDGAGYAKYLRGFCFVSWSFFCQRSQGDLTLFSRLKSLGRHLRTPLLMGKFYAHSSYSVIVCLNLTHELHLEVKKTIDSREYDISPDFSWQYKFLFQASTSITIFQIGFSLRCAEFSKILSFRLPLCNPQPKTVVVFLHSKFFFCAYNQTQCFEIVQRRSNKSCC